MTIILSPSFARINLKNKNKICLLNKLNCKNVHIDISYGKTFKDFLSFNKVQNSKIYKIRSVVTWHLFLFRKYIPEINFIRENDLIVLHIFKNTDSNLITDFINYCKNINCRVGLSLDIETDPKKIKNYLKLLDNIFIMSIPIATCGLPPDRFFVSRLKYIEDIIDKDSLNCKICVDGGVSEKTFASLINLKISELVIGGLLFNSKDVELQWKKLNNIIYEHCQKL